MKYALLIYPGKLASDNKELSAEESSSIFGEYVALLDEPGVLGAEQLQPSNSATTVRIENGQTLVTDGPYANTKEILGGFYLLEADDLDPAIEIAGRMPGAREGGAVEVRPLVER